jgi:hypothetical protein
LVKKLHVLEQPDFKKNSQELENGREQKERVGNCPPQAQQRRNHAGK